MASYIKERTKNAQFIVISLRNNMFELASRLVGVYKVNQMVCISFLGDSIRRLMPLRPRASRLRIRIISSDHSQGMYWRWIVFGSLLVFHDSCVRGLDSSSGLHY